jgi:nitric oxide reductase large subunit
LSHSLTFFSTHILNSTDVDVRLSELLSALAFLFSLFFFSSAFCGRQGANEFDVSVTHMMMMMMMTTTMMMMMMMMMMISMMSTLLVVAENNKGEWHACENIDRQKREIMEKKQR